MSHDILHGKHLGIFHIELESSIIHLFYDFIERNIFFDFDFEAARPVAGAISRAAANNKTRDLERIRI